jgi:hypothetical protein
MKKRSFLYILLAMFFIGCSSPSEFNSNVIITTDGNKSKDTLDTLKTDENTTCKPLQKTGQTKVHYNNDDGDLQKGVTRSYTRDDLNQIVTDNVMGLMWQDNESIKKPWVTQENYVGKNYMETNGDTAETYCESLGLGGYENWRLPTGDELYYLIDRGFEKPSIDSVFQNTVYDDPIVQSNVYDENNSYWSSTTSKTDSKAWLVNFDDGYDYDKGKNYDFFVRCVRGENKITHNFVRDPSKKVVNDTKTCLMWQDDTVAKTITRTWEKAIEHCNDLDFAGLDGWRVPNINELNSIRDVTKYKQMINDAFVNVSANGYWSSTTQSDWDNYAWTIYFDEGYTKDDNKSYTYNVRCVRSGE